jgi:hypothetical protein
VLASIVRIARRPNPAQRKRAALDRVTDGWASGLPRPPNLALWHFDNTLPGSVVVPDNGSFLGAFDDAHRQRNPTRPHPSSGDLTPSPGFFITWV